MKITFYPFWSTNQSYETAHSFDLIFIFSACLFASFVQDSLTNLIGLKSLYLFGLITFGLSMLITVVFPSVIVLNVCAAFSGIGFSVATTIPGTLVRGHPLMTSHEF